MENLALSTVVKAIDGKLCYHGSRTTVAGIARFINKAGAGYLVVEKKPGPHLEDRIRRCEQHKVTALVLSESEYKAFARLKYKGSVSIIVSAKPLACYYRLARYYRSLFKLPIVAITGSCGKTTTKEMLAAILATAGPVLKTYQNYNAPPGVCYNLYRLKNEHKFGVLEMGMKSTGQIRLMCSLAKPRIGIITNIGVAHYGIAGGVKKIIQAKGELVTGLPSNGILILNNDDANSKKLPLHKFKGTLVTYGIKNDALIQAKNLKPSLKGVHFTLRYKGKDYPNFFVPLLGTHNVYNALGAIAAAIHLKVPIADIKKGLARMSNARKRLQVLKSRSGALVVDDTYNANPESMRAAISTLATFRNTNQTIAVLGDMLELGEYTQIGHEQVGKAVAQANIHFLVTIGKKARIIAKTAQAAGMAPEKIKSFESKKDALTYLKSFVSNPNSIILVKASRDMGLDTISRGLAQTSPAGSSQPATNQPSQTTTQQSASTQQPQTPTQQQGLQPSRRSTVSILRVRTR